ncbi:unnamed protein product [Fraxinus pennsylvanica]|uniref:Apple domain-containing protein n=1 Tax=Fraxinus pennsylvanica TaxID=56036 RepID=A0AAD1ZMS3_9LAMI|nr:unnamed protein product [Fraxinus pennsylvanica]
MSSAGKLIITSNGSDPIELYAGGNGTNMTAKLLNSGNFVVMNGIFTLEWDPARHRLIVKRRGLVYWTSGDLKNYTDENSRLNVKEFENIVMKPDVFNFNYNFTYVSNGVEDYFSYSLIIDPKLTSERQKTVSGLRLKFNGDIYDMKSLMIAPVSLCYGNYTRGCELREQPRCRNHNETFVWKSGHFVNGDGSQPIADDNASHTESDCRDNCWKDCECVGFTSGLEYGCSYWRGKYWTFVQSYDGIEAGQFVLVSEASNKTESSTKRWKTWKIITLVITVVVILLGCVWFIIQKIEQAIAKANNIINTDS